MALTVGLEPTTNRLTADGSTTELRQNIFLNLTFFFRKGFKLWRSERDSNPRTDFSAYSLSRGAPYSHLGTTPCYYYIYILFVIILFYFKEKWRCVSGATQLLKTRYSEPIVQHLKKTHQKFVVDICRE